MTKQIDWSYPTSDNATKLGFGKVGCWTVSVKDGDHYGDGKVAKAVAGFPTQEEAIAYARSLPMPFGRLWQKYEAA